MKSVTAFAPATVANVAVGFDVLGFALEGVGDRVTVRERNQGDGGPVVVEEIRGVVTDIPSDPARNTAAVALGAMLEDLGLDARLALILDKGIPLSAGMGGSAASAVGAVVAANELLGRPAAIESLLGYALAGEAAASGAPHADNAAPCLYGGLTAVLPGEPPEVVPLQVPDEVLCVLVHPRLHVSTREARAVLRPQIALEDHVRQSARLAAFIAGCLRGDLALIGRSMEDVLIEPQRSSAVPGFDRAKREALRLGALGFSIAGSGPSVFAWVASRERGEPIARAVVEVFEDQGLEAEHWISRMNAPGAFVVGRR